MSWACLSEYCVDDGKQTITGTRKSEAAPRRGLAAGADELWSFRPASTSSRSEGRFRNAAHYSNSEPPTSGLVKRKLASLGQGFKGVSESTRCNQQTTVCEIQGSVEAG